MAELTSKSARRFQRYLDEQGLECQVVELAESTRSAQEAAQALGCQQAQIVKSLVFRATASDEPVIALVSGSNRVDEARLAEQVGEAIDKADAKFVKERTGFSIGGVAPIGHRQPCRVFVDEDLFAYDKLWAAAGTPHAVFALTQPLTAILGAHERITCR